METSKKLFEDLTKAVHDLREIAELRGRSLDELRTSMKAANDEIDILKKELELRARPVIPEISAGKGERTPERRAFEKFLRYGTSDAAPWSSEERAIFRRHQETRALAGTSDTDGGFLIPDDFSSEILSNAYDESQLLQYTNNGTTGRDVVSTPSMSKAVVGWGTTGVAVSDQAMSTGMVKIQIEYLQALVLIGEDVLADAQANVEAQLNQMFAEAVAEAKDDAIVVGTGATQPQGIVSSAAIQANAVNSGIAALLVDATHNGFDVLTQALMTLKQKYRRRATFVFNSNTERVLRTSKDSNGMYLWNLRGSLGEIDTILNKPYAVAEGMPDIAANSFPVVVGDLSRYWVRDRSGVVVQRLIERYSEFGQVGFRLKVRTGGAPMLAEAFVPVKIAV